jgi:hypothetical protein
MADAARIEQDLLGLPPAERERLALSAWESLVEDSAASANPELDPEDVRIALRRDIALDRGMVRALSEDEFRHSIND